MPTIVLGEVACDGRFGGALLSPTSAAAGIVLARLANQGLRTRVSPVLARPYPAPLLLFLSKFLSKLLLGSALASVNALTDCQSTVRFLCSVKVRALASHQQTALSFVEPCHRHLHEVVNALGRRKPTDATHGARLNYC